MRNARRIQAAHWRGLVGATAAVVALALAPTASPAPPDESGVDAGEDQFAVAATHYAKARWDLAERELQRLLREFPQHSRATAARFYLGEARSQQRRYADARAAYLDYLAHSATGPHAGRARYRAAEAAYLAGDRRTAVEEFAAYCQSSAEADELIARAAAYLGKAALAEEQFDEAKRRFQQALDAGAEGELADDVRLGLSQALQAAGDAATAASTLQELSGATQNARSDEARYRLGVLHYNQKQYAEAIDSFAAFETTFRDSPLRARAMLSRGWAFYRLQRFDEAASAFHTAASEPDLAERARYWQALTSLAQEDWRAAVRTLTELKRSAPSDVPHDDVLYHLAAAEHRFGAIDAAASHFARIADASEFAESSWKAKSLFALTRIAKEQNEPLVARDRAQALTRLDAAEAADARAIAVPLLLAASRTAEAAELLGLVSDPTPRDRYLQAAASRAEGRSAAALETLETLSNETNPPSLAADVGFLQGVVLFELEQWVAALAALDRHAEQYPNHAERSAREARRLVAAARCGAGDRAAKLAETLAEGVQAAAAVHQAAELFFDAEEFATAERLFHTLERIGDDDQAAAAVSGLAWSAQAQGDIETATIAFRRLLCEHPASSPAIDGAFAAAEAAADRGDFDEAVGLLDFARAADPERSGAAQLAAAVVLRRAGRPAEAIVRLEPLLADAHDADAAQVVYQRAWCARELGDEAAATACFLRIHDRYPDCSIWADATLRAAVAVRETRGEQAADLMEEVVRRAAGTSYAASALYGLSQLAAAEERWPEVRERCQPLLTDYAEEPIAAKARFWSAEAAYHLEDPDALAEFEALGEDLDPQWAPLAALRRGQLLARRDDYPAALDAAEGVVQAWPQYALKYEADYLIGRCLAALGEYDRARRSLQRVVLSSRGGKTETAAMAQWMIGETYFHQKRYDDAMSAYLRVSILFGYPKWKAAALLQAGKCAELLEQPPRAEEFYAEALVADPGGEFAEELQQRRAAIREVLARRERSDVIQQ